MSAVQFDAFMDANPMFVVTREADEDEDGKYETKTAYNAEILFYNAKGKSTEYANEKWSDGEAVTFGFDVKADTKGTGATEMWMPETYKVTLIAKKAITTV